MCLLNTENLWNFDEGEYISRTLKPRKNMKDNDYECDHTPEQRGWIGTYTHLEIQRALESGFKIKKILWVWNWQKWNSSIFKEYVKTFYGLKVQSEWDKEKNTIEERDEFIRKFKEFYDIDLNPEKMELNPGMRYIAKHCLNSVNNIFLFLSF